MDPKKTPKVIIKLKIVESNQCGFLHPDLDKDLDNVVSVTHSSDTEFGPSPLKRTKPCFVADVDTGAVAGTFTS
jgi:hypothetical protein